MLSIIIPAYNEELLLPATLVAIHAAAGNIGEEYEIVVADDASSDRTAEVAERGGARVVKANHRQIAATRNSGARAARGDRFLFVDADTLVTERVVRGAVLAMRRGAAGGGANVKFDEPMPLYARVVLPLMLIAYRVLGLAPGCCLFCTRRAFERAGGFNERKFGAEELYMSWALARSGPFVLLNDAVLNDPAGLLEGAGKRMRHVKIKPGEKLDAEALADLIKASYRDIRRRLEPGDG